MCILCYVISYLVKYLHTHLFEIRGVNPPVDVQVTIWDVTGAASVLVANIKPVLHVIVTVSPTAVVPVVGTAIEFSTWYSDVPRRALGQGTLRRAPTASTIHTFHVILI